MAKGFASGDRVETTDELTFNDKKGKKKLPAGSRGTVDVPGDLRSDVDMDGDKIRRINNGKLRVIEGQEGSG